MLVRQKKVAFVEFSIFARKFYVLFLSNNFVDRRERLHVAAGFWNLRKTIDLPKLISNGIRKV